MTLEETAQQEEDRLLKKRPIHDAATLKQILREGLTIFEREMDQLPREERDEAIRLYLDRIRKVTYSFHYALRVKEVENAVLAEPSPCYDEHSNRFERRLLELFRLYRIPMKRKDASARTSHPL